MNYPLTKEDCLRYSIARVSMGLYTVCLSCKQDCGGTSLEKCEVCGRSLCSECVEWKDHKMDRSLCQSCFKDK
jgi:hypothetical protein